MTARAERTLAVVLAAGGGSRFTAPHPQAAGRPRRSQPSSSARSAAAVAAGIGPVLVIAGAVAAARLDRRPRPACASCTTRGWAEGQAHLARTPPSPRRDGSDVEAVVDRTRRPAVDPARRRGARWPASTAPIAIATYDGRRRNPVRLASLGVAAAADRRRRGRPVVMRMRPDLVEEVPCQRVARRHRHPGGPRTMAEQIVNEFTVNRPIDEAWPIICDVERIAPCLPGAQLEEIEGDIYRGKVKVKLGAVATEFAGEAQFVERDDVDPPRQARRQGPRHQGTRQRRRRHLRRGRSAVAHQHQVHRHRRPPHHRQGRPVRPRDHGRRQQEADRPVRRQPQHDARRAGQPDRARPSDRPASRRAGASRAGCRRRADAAATRRVAPVERRRRRRRCARSTVRPPSRSIWRAWPARPCSSGRHRRVAAVLLLVLRVAPPAVTEARRGARPHARPIAARVRELLGASRRAGITIAARDSTGDPVVIRNAPLLDDGTPMPTLYWLVGPDEVRRVGRLEAEGGVDAAEADDRPGRAGRSPRPLCRRARRRDPARPRRAASVRRGRRHAHRGQVPARPLGMAPRRR